MSTLKSILKENIVQMGLIEELSPTYIALVLVSALCCGILIYLVYRCFYRGAVYSENFGILLVMTTLTVAFVIMTIASNIVLSLGMVGALSIVRFRTAVKDPLDVGFLFLSIAAGLTAGAGLFLIAGIGTVFICMVFIGFFMLDRRKSTFLLIVRYENSSEEEVYRLISLTKHKVKSVAKRADRTESAYMVNYRAQDILSELADIKGVEDAQLIAYTGDGQY
ncbi:MAG: DUF4956 domain-containing protein [Lachnospiraceae bacterium]|nr:DUF4956 domain-containing protein [Lachnospiraceae bacterium]